MSTNDLELIPFDELLGALVYNVVIDAEDSKVTFNTDKGKYLLFHSQDCCESVYLVDGHDGLSQLKNETIEMAEEVSSFDIPPHDRYDEHYLWTFYKIATRERYVVLRWYGHSNGYYGVSANLYRESD